MTETFYDVLGVRPDATTEEIEAAYRDAIKRVHPDVSDDVDAGERTKRLNKAKRVLTDESERERYDRVGHEAFTGEGAAGRNDAGGSAAGSGASTAGADGPATGTDGSANAADSAGSSGADRTGSSGPSSGTERTRSSDSNRRDSASSGPTDSSRSRSGGAGSRRGRASDAEGDGESESESTWRGSQQRGRRSRNGPNARPGERARRTRSDSQRARPGDGRPGGPTADGTTRSRGDSTGPSWQSGVDETGTGPSARRQAAAAANGGPNVDWSWNDRASAESWAVRDGFTGRGLQLSRLFPIDQSVVLLASTFFLYPFFVASALFPPFPLAARVVVAVCTLLTFAYLLSIPEAAIAVFGLWSVLVPIALLAFPGLSLFSLVGVIALVATWVPLGLSVLTFTLVRP